MGTNALKAVPLLARTARDSSPELRYWSTWSLGQIGGPEAEAALLLALQDPKPLIREQAKRAQKELAPRRTP
jgi:HEAT repeat protein